LIRGDAAESPRNFGEDGPLADLGAAAHDFRLAHEALKVKGLDCGPEVHEAARAGARRGAVVIRSVNTSLIRGGTCGKPLKSWGQGSRLARLGRWPMISDDTEGPKSDGLDCGPKLHEAARAVAAHGCGDARGKNSAGGNLGKIWGGHRVHHLYRLFLQLHPAKWTSPKTDLGQLPTLPCRRPKKGGKGGDAGGFSFRTPGGIKSRVPGSPSLPAFLQLHPGKIRVKNGPESTPDSLPRSRPKKGGEAGDPGVFFSPPRNRREKRW